MNNDYFLMRHGKTIYQGQKRKFVYPSLNKQNSITLTLSSKGKLRKTAKIIKNKKIDLIYSSDICRTRQTAEIVSKEVGVKINFDKRLREIKHGIFSGKTKKEFYQVLPDPRKRFRVRPKGGENWNDVKRRVASFLKDIERKHKNKNILVVSHGDALWLLEGMIRDMTNEELLAEIFIKKKYIQPEEFREIIVK
ncbi:MAG: histidine phosphatase family protein [Candidatus Nealsonbacteria bacterium]